MNTCKYIHTLCKLIKSSLLALFLLPLFTLNAWAGCDVPSFSSLALPGDASNIVIDSASIIPATLTSPTYCDVRGRLDSASTSVIKFDVGLPSPWNGKLFMLGNGGFAGLLTPLAVVLNRNYATATTDTGHVGSGNPTWAFNNPLGKKNFGYRAVHLTALLSKEIISAYYGQPAQYSYFSSCSNGGRQALMEAQRYPTDFNGIISGDPAFNITSFILKFTQEEQALFPNVNFANPTIALSKLPLIQAAVLNKCDALDGITDGIVNNPKKCHFNPKIDLPRCVNDIDGPSCFTSQQVDALNTIYHRLNAADHQSYPGFLPGAETYIAASGDWTSFVYGTTPTLSRASPAHLAGTPNADIFFAEGSFDNFVTFTNRTQPVSYLDFDLRNKQDVADWLVVGPVLNADNPDLSAFQQNNGKLILYHGWDDPALSPLSTIAYYKSVEDMNGGKEETQNFARLFMVPGMLHCTGGPGPYIFDRVTALDNWVVNGVAPDSMIGTNPVSGLSRPLCPYPQTAVLNDGLDATNSVITNNAANFHCVKGNDNEGDNNSDN